MKMAVPCPPNPAQTIIIEHGPAGKAMGVTVARYSESPPSQMSAAPITGKTQKSKWVQNKIPFNLCYPI